jgi:hypothetical protein
VGAEGGDEARPVDGEDLAAPDGRPGAARVHGRSRVS